MLEVYGLSVITILRELAANIVMSIPMGRRLRLKGLRTSATTVSDEAKKIIAEFDFFKDSAGNLEGKTVVEIGTGDAIGLAPLFLSAGAVLYVAFDRFPGNVWGPQAEALYGELARLRGPFQANWRERTKLCKTAIEAVAQYPIKADLIVSFNVIEHLSDLARAVRNMVALLKPDGMMIHRVDYGPHGVWLSSRGALDFLRVPARLWNVMGSHRGYPNRVSHAGFTQILKSSGLQVSERVTQARGSYAMDAEIMCGYGAPLSLGRCFKTN